MTQEQRILQAIPATNVEVATTLPLSYPWSRDSNDDILFTTTAAPLLSKLDRKYALPLIKTKISFRTT